MRDIGKKDFGALPSVKEHYIHGQDFVWEVLYCKPLLPKFLCKGLASRYILWAYEVACHFDTICLVRHLLERQYQRILHGGLTTW